MLIAYTTNMTLRRLACMIGLRPSSVRVLRVFFKDNSFKSVKELASSAKLSMASANDAVRELMAKGYLEFRKDRITTYKYHDVTRYRLKVSKEIIVKCWKQSVVDALLRMSQGD